MQSLTNAQILSNLQGNYEFGVNFIIDNNPEAIEQNLNANNILLQPNPTKAQLKAKIVELIDKGQGEMAIEILSVPYLNQVSGYTGGLEDPLKQVGTNNGVMTPKAVGVVIAVISLISTIGGGILAVKNQNAQTETQQQIGANLEAQYNLNQQEIEANKVLGLPKNLFYGIIGIVVLVIVLVALKK